MAIDTPTTKIRASGYRKSPPSLKKLMTELKKFICALLKKLIRSEHGIQSDPAKSEAVLLLTLLRRLRRPILGRVPPHGAVIGNLSLELVTVDWGQSLIQEAIHGLSREIPDIRLLPRHDIHDLWLLTVAGHGRRTQIEAVRSPRGLLAGDLGGTGRGGRSTRARSGGS